VDLPTADRYTLLLTSSSAAAAGSKLTAASGHACSSSVELKTNFESDKPSSWYSELYKKDDLAGGHVIMLGADDASK